jgi:hypothetical protein
MVCTRMLRCTAVSLMVGSAGWFAAAPAAASSVVPSLEWTGFTSFQNGHNMCSYQGGAFLAELDSGFTASQSDCYTATVAGVGAVSLPYCENGPFSPGPFANYGIAANGVVYAVPAGTPVTAEVRSYNGPNGTGPLTFTSRITFACDTGAVSSIVSFAPGSCATDATHLCLAGRFSVAATYDAGNGAAGTAQAVALTPDTGYLWFFNAANVEAVIKVINGCGLNNEFWVFAGGLTNVRTRIDVTDTVTGMTKRYNNPQGTPFQPIQDTSAFATCHAASSANEPEAAALPGGGSDVGGSDAAGADAGGSRIAGSGIAEAGMGGATVSGRGGANVAGTAGRAGVGESISGTSLLLNNDRFQVDVSWRTADGKSGTATPVALTGDTGYFWFFSSSNVEMVIKVLNACGLNHRYWVFAGGLTNVRTVIRVTDTATGKFKTYVNQQGVTFQPIQDTSAFSQCP